VDRCQNDRGPSAMPKRIREQGIPITNYYENETAKMNGSLEVDDVHFVDRIGPLDESHAGTRVVGMCSRQRTPGFVVVEVVAGVLASAGRDFMVAAGEAKESARCRGHHRRGGGGTGGQHGRARNGQHCCSGDRSPSLRTRKDLLSSSPAPISP